MSDCLDSSCSSASLSKLQSTHFSLSSRQKRLSNARSTWAGFLSQGGRKRFRKPYLQFISCKFSESRTWIILLELSTEFDGTIPGKHLINLPQTFRLLTFGGVRQPLTLCYLNQTLKHLHTHLPSLTGSPWYHLGLNFSSDFRLKKAFRDTSYILLSTIPWDSGYRPCSSCR